MNVLAWITIAVVGLAILTPKDDSEAITAIGALLGLALAIWTVAT